MGGARSDLTPMPSVTSRRREERRILGSEDRISGRRVQRVEPHEAACDWHSATLRLRGERSGVGGREAAALPGATQRGAGH